jgi:hypothetical protein
MPVMDWRLYNKTRAGKGRVGDIEALCRALGGAEEYLPGELAGMADEAAKLLRDWNRVASRVAKLEDDRKLLERFDTLRAGGATVAEACETIAEEPGAHGSAKGVEKAVERARRRLSAPLFGPDDD